MTDFFDRAQELEMRQRDEALARQADAARQQGASLSHCSDCGEEIAALRREKVPGCTRCVDCQTAAEKALRR
ncbi:TraR/DksA family transcriptional regulator [Gulbenkiania mobilis]|uniref:TraR/DksA family transcriptional regulator n=1 Tax=Gulbenkiania mobilis TaxID=397457 RepID=UPI0006BC040F|nr:TraR/DksA family transcriptional regulator [Gulbenkiania mobilis]